MANRSLASYRKLYASFSSLGVHVWIGSSSFALERLQYSSVSPRSTGISKLVDELTTTKCS